MQPKINNFLDHLPKEKRTELDVVLGQAIFTHGAPLSLIDKYYCGQFFLVIRPHNKPPSWDQISKKWLNDEYNIVRKLATEKIIDGMTEMVNPLPEIILTTLEPVFSNAIETKTERSDAWSFTISKLDQVTFLILQAKSLGTTYSEKYDSPE